MEVGRERLWGLEEWKMRFLVVKGGDGGVGPGVRRLECTYVGLLWSCRVQWKDASVNERA